VLHHPSIHQIWLQQTSFYFPNWNYNWKGSIFRTSPQYKQMWQSKSGAFRKTRLRKASNHCTSIVNRVLIDKGTMLNRGNKSFLTWIFYFLLT
jgi:beta-N-acetylglucosaminidase